MGKTLKTCTRLIDLEEPRFIRPYLPLGIMGLSERATISKCRLCRYVPCLNHAKARLKITKGVENLPIALPCLGLYIFPSLRYAHAILYAECTDLANS